MYHTVTRRIAPSINARYIRVQVKSWNSYVALRFELFGCNRGKNLWYFRKKGDCKIGLFWNCTMRPTWSRLYTNILCSYDQIWCWPNMVFIFAINATFILFFLNFFTVRRCSSPVGLQNNKLKNSLITASSVKSAQYSAFLARLHNHRRGRYI